MNKFKLAVFFGLFLCLLINGCSHNHVLDENGDKFALSVNQFEEKDIGNFDLAENCGRFYLKNQSQNNNASFFQSAMKSECDDKMQQLAKYLQNIPDFSNVTTTDLESQKAWQYYFKSQYAKGKFLQ